MVVVFSNGPSETQKIGSILAQFAVVGDVLVLSGDLGAGKTCFSQGYANGLGVEGSVTSPTFAIANRYRGLEFFFHHLDAYRVEGAGVVVDIDLPDLLETGVTLVEWGQRMDASLPADRLTITFGYVDDDSADVSDGAGDVFVASSRRVLTFEFSGFSWEDRVLKIKEAVKEWIVET